jgi:hypothetical protein
MSVVDKLLKGKPLYIMLVAILINVSGRLILQEGAYRLPLGAAPLVPVVFFVAGMYGLEAALLTAIPSLVISLLLNDYTYGLGNIQSILLFVGAVITSIFIGLKIFKLTGPSNFMYRIALTTIFIEVMAGLIGGSFFRYPEGVFHLIANLIIGGFIIITLGAPKHQSAK